MSQKKNHPSYRNTPKNRQYEQDQKVFSKVFRPNRKDQVQSKYKKHCNGNQSNQNSDVINRQSIKNKRNSDANKESIQRREKEMLVIQNCELLSDDNDETESYFSRIDYSSKSNSSVQETNIQIKQEPDFDWEENPSEDNEIEETDTKTGITLINTDLLIDSSSNTRLVSHFDTSSSLNSTKESSFSSNLTNIKSNGKIKIEEQTVNEITNTPRDKNSNSPKDSTIRRSSLPTNRSDKDDDVFVLPTDKKPKFDDIYIVESENGSDAEKTEAEDLNTQKTPIRVELEKMINDIIQVVLNTIDKISLKTNNGTDNDKNGSVDSVRRDLQSKLWTCLETIKCDSSYSNQYMLASILPRRKLESIVENIVQNSIQKIMREKTYSRKPKSIAIISPSISAVNRIQENVSRDDIPQPDIDRIQMPPPQRRPPSRGSRNRSSNHLDLESLALRTWFSSGSNEFEAFREFVENDVELQRYSQSILQPRSSN